MEFMGFLARRVASLIITLFTISLITFLVCQIIPGDPALLILGTDAHPEAIEHLREQLGLNRPVLTRYAGWVAQAVRGDLGTSIRLRRPVLQLIAHNLRVTGPLALMAGLFAILMSIPMGIYAAIHHGTRGDYGVIVFSQLGVSIPNFWVGFLLILFFAVRLRLFAPGGFVTWETSVPLALKSLLLPAVALGLGRAAMLTRLVRSSMLETLGMDYIRTARAKGLQEKIVIYKHALKNALIPVVTVIGMHLAALLAGSIVIEQVFTLPGMGRLMLMAISYRDFVMIQGIILFVATAVVSMNFVVDIVYTRIDPRIRFR